MTYLYASSQADATKLLDGYIAKGYRGYILGWVMDKIEVRVWK